MPQTDEKTTRERAYALRELGMSYRQIAGELGVSKARIGQILHPYNADGRMLRYRCERCGHSFSSAARSKPSRCPAVGGCGSVYWNRATPAAA